VGCDRTRGIGSRTSFVITSVLSNILSYIYVFRGNPFKVHSLEQSYPPTQPFNQEKCNTKPKMCHNNIKLNYLTLIHCTCKFRSPKLFLLSQLEIISFLTFGPGIGHLNSSTSFMQNVNILRTKTGNVMKYTTFCRGIN
jgi:hypothetical protein